MKTPDTTTRTLENESPHSELGGNTAARDFVTLAILAEGYDDTDFMVLEFEGVEELNRPYCFRVRVAPAQDAVAPSELLGRTVQLTLSRVDHHRHLCGIVSQVVDDGDRDWHASATIHIVPALAALALNRATRIFQEMSGLEISELVLREGLSGYRREFDSSGLDRSRYLNRDYCVQYRESHLDFVNRLFEEEGIGYCFEHADGVERLVLFDANAQLREVETIDGGAVMYAPVDAVVGNAERVVEFQLSKKLSSTQVTIRDHDWTRARPAVEQSRHTAGSASAHELYEHGLGNHITITEDQEELATLLGLIQRAVIPNGLPSAAVGAIRAHLDLPGSLVAGFTRDNSALQAEIRSDLVQRDSLAARGASELIALSPGRHFQLAGHPTDDDAQYLVTRVVHQSRADNSRLAGPEQTTDRSDERVRNYINRFECCSLATAWRPERRTPKPEIHGVQTATVTAPLGADLHTDQYGRVRVKFQWDRSSPDPRGQDSCWIRVSQMWAGAGYPGVSFIPRAGMEVVVSFIDGDPDRPLVVGCVHNARNSTPHYLPGQATKSVIRTRTVPHGPGYNEISFEDAMGMERIHIRAERDLTQHAQQDRSSFVGRDDTNVVRGDQSEKILGAQSTHVAHDRMVSVGGMESHAVRGSLFESIQGPAVRRLGHGEEVSCLQGDRCITVEDGRHITAAKSDVIVASKERVIVSVGSSRVVATEDAIELTVGSSKLRVDASGVRINGNFIPA